MNIKVVKESDEELFDLPEYRAERMLSYIQDCVDDLQSRYDTAIDLNGAIEPGLFKDIEKMYKCMP